MDQEVEKFLDVEKKAEQLVNELKALHEQAVSYKDAKQELDAVSKRLVDIIDETEKFATNTHNMAKIMLEIGAPEILSRVKSLEERIGDEFTKNAKSTKLLTILLSFSLVASIIAIALGIFSLIR